MSLFLKAKKGNRPHPLPSSRHTRQVIENNLFFLNTKTWKIWPSDTKVILTSNVNMHFLWKKIKINKSTSSQVRSCHRRTDGPLPTTRCCWDCAFGALFFVTGLNPARRHVVVTLWRHVGNSVVECRPTIGKKGGLRCCGSGLSWLHHGQSKGAPFIPFKSAQRALRFFRNQDPPGFVPWYSCATYKKQSP